mmetsp:Transcript_13491/g.39532  ORF Transcript_13491/g.39532 Transcript_13491/m.39532 type:complete len:203 (+) Transcript_13491:398-1006(+)
MGMPTWRSPSAPSSWRRKGRACPSSSPCPSRARRRAATRSRWSFTRQTRRTASGRTAWQGPTAGGSRASSATARRASEHGCGWSPSRSAPSSSPSPLSRRARRTPPSSCSRTAPSRPFSQRLPRRRRQRPPRRPPPRRERGAAPSTQGQRTSGAAVGALRMRVRLTRVSAAARYIRAAVWHVQFSFHLSCVCLLCRGTERDC